MTALAPRLTITSDSDAFVRELGRVRDWHIGVEDHGIFSFNLNFEFGGSVQGCGHYGLGSDKHGWVTVAFLERLSRILGPMQDWKGKMVHVLRLEPYGQIVGIETLPTAREYHRVIFKEVFGESYGGESA
jgi:hypothetical protein